jgi:hypothetical protein
MTDQIEEKRTCVRGCTRTDGSLMEATHGDYCARCWGRVKSALSVTAELAQHLVGNAISSGGASDDRVDASREAPVPFNQAAFDDASEVYSLLVYWVTVWADHLRTRVPSFQPPSDENGYSYRLGYGRRRTAWRNGRGRIIGLPADTTPGEAHLAVEALSRWLRDRLDLILASGHRDDVDALDEAIRDVWRINARWPRLERPAYSPIPCPREECGRRIAVYPPGFPGDERRALCDAGHFYLETEFEHLKNVFMQVAEEQKRANKVAAHLAKKHGFHRPEGKAS